MCSIQDLETGAMRWINTSSSKVRQSYNKWWYERQQAMIQRLNRCRVDFASIATDEDFVKSLMGLFKKRGPR